MNREGARGSWWLLLVVRGYSSNREDEEHKCDACCSNKNNDRKTLHKGGDVVRERQKVVMARSLLNSRVREIARVRGVYLMLGGKEEAENRKGDACVHGFGLFVISSSKGEGCWLLHCCPREERGEGGEVMEWLVVVIRLSLLLVLEERNRKGWLCWFHECPHEASCFPANM